MKLSIATNFKRPEAPLSHLLDERTGRTLCNRRIRLRNRYWIYEGPLLPGEVPVVGCRCCQRRYDLMSKEEEAKPRDLVQTMRYMTAVRQASRSLPGAAIVGIRSERIHGWLVAPAFHEDVLNATLWMQDFACVPVEQTAEGFELWGDMHPDYYDVPMHTIRSCSALSTWFATIEPAVARKLLSY